MAGEAEACRWGRRFRGSRRRRVALARAASPARREPQKSHHERQLSAESAGRVGALVVVLDVLAFRVGRVVDLAVEVVVDAVAGLRVLADRERAAATGVVGRCEAVVDQAIAVVVEAVGAVGRFELAGGVAAVADFAVVWWDVTSDP